MDLASTDELQEEEEQEQKSFHKQYKVMEGDTVLVRRNDIVSKSGRSYTFYSINIASKDLDGKNTTFKKEIQFKKGVSIQDGTRIKVLNMFERVRNDPHSKYYPIWGLFINDFEIVDQPNYYELQNEIEDYQGVSGEVNDDGLVEVNW